MTNDNAFYGPNEKKKNTKSKQRIGLKSTLQMILKKKIKKLTTTKKKYNAHPDEAMM